MKQFKLLSCVLTFLAVTMMGKLKADELYTAMLAAPCAQCHGTEGKAIGGQVAMLAGMDKTHFITRFKEFRDSATKPADVTVMHQIAKGFNDSQIEALATYFNSIK